MPKIRKHSLAPFNCYSIEPKLLIVNVLFFICFHTVKAQDCVLIPTENLNYYSNYEKIDSIFKEAITSQKKLTILIIDSNQGGFSTEIFELDSMGQFNFSVFECDSLVDFRKGALLDPRFFSAPLPIVGAFQAYCTTTRYFHTTKTILVCAMGQYFVLTSFDGEFDQCLNQNQLYVQDFANYFEFVDLLLGLK